MSILQLSTCTVDLTRELISRDGETIRLTSREASLLRYFAQHPHEPIAREILLQEVWGYSESVVSRTIDTTIRRLRGKLEHDPKNPAHLLTVFGLGYRFEPLEAPAPVHFSETWAPEGCPRPGEALGAFLGEARKLAERRGDGFVGLEHLLLLYPQTPPGGLLDATIRQICRSEQVISSLTGLSVAHGDRAVCWAGTPRLRRICAGLRPQASLADFWQAVLADPSRGIHAIDRGRALPVNPLLANRVAPARSLEVIGGPEDGRQLRPRARDRIGRWWPGRVLEHALYEMCTLEDAQLSRSGSFDWQGENRVFFRGGGTILRWRLHDAQPGATRGAEQPGLSALPAAVGETLVVHTWDLICPTPATTLQVLP